MFLFYPISLIRQQAGPPLRRAALQFPFRSARPDPPKIPLALQGHANKVKLQSPNCNAYPKGLGGNPWKSKRKISKTAF